MQDINKKVVDFVHKCK